MSGSPTIVGQGLAGTCVAWHLRRRGVAFSIADRGDGGASRVAAGLINPVTGKNFEPSWRIGEFLPEAIAFYRDIGELLGVALWHPMTVLRLAETEKQWAKIRGKLALDSLKPWIGAVVPAPAGWAGAVEVTGGGRVDTRTFVDASREFFRERGLLVGEPAAGPQILCEGAAGLIAGKYGEHRSAKGEILTVSARGWDETRIRVGAGGWLVPLGGGLFRAGATYDWSNLDVEPTEAGRATIQGIVRKLGGGEFEIVDHVAGIRPIVRKSRPLIGKMDGGDWMFNGLGSKGSLYAPGVAARLVRSILEGGSIEEDLDFGAFSDKES